MVVARRLKSTLAHASVFASRWRCMPARSFERFFTNPARLCCGTRRRPPALAGFLAGHRYEDELTRHPNASRPCRLRAWSPRRSLGHPDASWFGWIPSPKARGWLLDIPRAAMPSRIGAIADEHRCADNRSGARQFLTTLRQPLPGIREGPQQRLRRPGSAAGDNRFSQGRRPRGPTNDRTTLRLRTLRALLRRMVPPRSSGTPDWAGGLDHAGSDARVQERPPSLVDVINGAYSQLDSAIPVASR
jgi:hypothetical protein